VTGKKRKKLTVDNGDGFLIACGNAMVEFNQKQSGVNLPVATVQIGCCYPYSLSEALRGDSEQGQLGA
jgi:hypothetical protein